jgi:hypothetical protein
MEKVHVIETVTSVAVKDGTTETVLEYVDDNSEKADDSKEPSFVNTSEKTVPKSLSAARSFLTEILLVEDDPTQNPWTFRMWFVGIGLSLFAG